LNSQRRLPDPSDRWLLLVLAAAILSLVAWLLAHGVRVTEEDGFYYLKIAQHLAAGAGSTFDGVNPTNGYHPLWALILVPLFRVSPTPAAALNLAIMVQGLFMAGAVIFVYQTARLTTGRLSATAAALTWTWLTYRVGLGGLEFSIHALTVLAVGYLVLRHFALASPGRLALYWLLGLLLGLTLLARLDTILLGGVLILMLAWRELRQIEPLRVCRTNLSLPYKPGIQRLAAVGLPILLVSGLYGGLNLALFGHLTPVSGAIKRVWSAYLLAQDPYHVAYGWLIAKGYQLLWPFRHIDQASSLSLISGVFGAGGLWLSGVLGPGGAAWAAWLRQVLRPWQPFIVYSILNYLSYGLLYHAYLSFSAWYYVIQPWLVALLVAALIDKLASLGRGRAGVDQRSQPKQRWRSVAGPVLSLSLVMLLVLVMIRAVAQWHTNDRLNRIPQPLYQAAGWIKANLPEEATVGAWNAGAIGYLSERRVVNLDGLVNTWAFHQHQQYDLCRYWQEQGITHLVDVFDQRPGPKHVVPSAEPIYPYYARCADQLELLWAAEIFPGAWWRLEAYRVRGSEGSP